jgi:hypothetical protein
MTKPDIYLSVEIGSDKNNILDILDLVPHDCDCAKYYNIGDVCRRDLHIYKESFYRYRYYNSDLFDANLFIEHLFIEIPPVVFKKIISLDYYVLIVFNIILSQDNNILTDASLPDAGLSANLMKILGDMGIDYHVQISI